MTKQKKNHFVGLAKVIFNSSVCHINESASGKVCEVYLTDRLIRKKSSKHWPEKAISLVDKKIDRENAQLVENREVATPLQCEMFMNKHFPFFEYLKKKNLDYYSKYFNKKIEFMPHHLCHAYAALAMSPFEKSIILVIDGAGTSINDFSQDEVCSDETPVRNSLEECSVYFQNGGKLTLASQKWQLFKDGIVDNHSISNGLGTLYEKASEFIFNSKTSAGKVMGLAAFGSSREIVDKEKFLVELDWKRSFKGQGKKEWEFSENNSLYRDIAASVQRNFEESLFKICEELNLKYPEYKNLIFTGGCALNCTSNMKLVKSKKFHEIYIPPFPGDDGISFGLANSVYLKNNPSKWSIVNHNDQHGYYGPISSIPIDDAVESTFKDYKIFKPNSITKYTAKTLSKGHIVAWFQGRSESGPRALGNRSILAQIDRLGLKDYLNSRVKFRESFRPYGCSCTHEMASEYFEVSQGFNNPFMSFSVKIREKYRESLREVMHVDGTSRMQTVRSGQNKRFHKLIKTYGDLTGLYCLLNTSLNVMGEPIVETVEDARNFFDRTKIYGMAIGNYFITKN